MVHGAVARQPRPEQLEDPLGDLLAPFGLLPGRGCRDANGPRDRGRTTRASGSPGRAPTSSAIASAAGLPTDSTALATGSRWPGAAVAPTGPALFAHHAQPQSVRGLAGGQDGRRSVSVGADRARGLLAPSVPNGRPHGRGKHPPWFEVSEEGPRGDVGLTRDICNRHPSKPFSR